VNDDLHVDFENPQMLKCIVYILEKVISNCFVLKESLIKYDKINGIIPMKTHVDYVHLELFVQRKSQLL